jgi:hypothetical protein
MVNDPAGYIWSFPRPDHLAIGICAAGHRRGSGSVARHRDEMDSTAQNRAGRQSRVVFVADTVAAGGGLRCDDTRRNAMADGRRRGRTGRSDHARRHLLRAAVRAVAADALTTSPGDAARHYVEQVRDGIGTELRAAAQLKAGFFRAGFSGLMLDALASSQKIRAVMADLVAGAQSYRTLNRRLAGTFEIRLAWRWVRSRHRTA